jgi:microcin C transport system permease protein
MLAYIIRRILLMIPTIFGIMALSFAVVQFAPGGPIERVIAQLQGTDVSATERFAGGSGDFSSQDQDFRRQREIPAASIAARRGSTRNSSPSLSASSASTSRRWNALLLMIWNYARFDFGESYFRDVAVIDLIIEKLPVSISLGLWMTLLSYGISIPLGIAKAVKRRHALRYVDECGGDCRLCDPGLPVRDPADRAVCRRLVLGSLPADGLTSENWDQLPWWQKILDYFWHLTLPLIAMAVGAFATTTLLTKNSFLDEIRKQYVVTARAKGLG